MDDHTERTDRAGIWPLLLGALVAGIALVGWVLWVLFATDTNPLNRFLAAKETPAQLASGFELALYLCLACLALVHAATLWTIVRTNAFGPKSDA